MDPRKIVRDGYDLVSEAYRSESFDYERSKYREFVEWLVPDLRAGDRILDLGCGCGVPVARTLARRFRVLGVDFSAVQIRRARSLVPDAVFRCEDFTAVRFPPRSFEAIVAFYSIIHLPVDEQPALFDSIASWLVPGGTLLISVGSESWTGTEPDWRGVPGAAMYWSHADADTYREWLAGRGFEIQKEGFLPEGDGGHPVFLARRQRTAALPRETPPT